MNAKILNVYNVHNLNIPERYAGCAPWCFMALPLTKSTGFCRQWLHCCAGRCIEKKPFFAEWLSYNKVSVRIVQKNSL
jgi:hypothetical protein